MRIGPLTWCGGWPGVSVTDAERDLVVHQTSTLVGQRIVAIALGYEDVDDHDTLRFDPVLGLLSDLLEPKRDDCARLAGKSTLNRLERSAASDLNPRYHKLTARCGGLSRACLSICSWTPTSARPSGSSSMSMPPTIPCTASRKGVSSTAITNATAICRFTSSVATTFWADKLRPSNIDASAGATDEVARIVGRIRHRWPKVEVLLRGDSAFAREEIMAWCEANGVDYVFGLAKNERLVTNIEGELALAAAEHVRTGKATRRFKEFSYQTPRELEPAPPGGGQGRALGERIQSALHRYLLGRG